MIKYPDYKNSIVTVMNSILAHYGVNTHHETLPLLDKLLVNNYKNVVLLVFDGLGINVIEQNLEKNCFLRQHIISEISSVYPCTTTAALTSILSGLTPNEHGWVGWSCYFKEVDKCVNLFNNAESYIKDGESVCKQHLANTYLSYENIFSQITKATNGNITAYSVSPFSSCFANTCDGICNHLNNLCSEDGRKFIYAYHFQPDSNIHHFGINDKCIKEMIEDFNNQIEALVNGLEDTLFLITADHGMINVQMKCIEDYPQLHKCLKRHICLESRFCSFYVKKAYISTFKQIFIDTFGDKFKLFTHNEFIEKGWLGCGVQHSRINDFIGDFIAVAVSDIALWYKNSAGEKKDFKAAHSGLTEEEMTVPLIAIKCTNKK